MKPLNAYTSYLAQLGEVRQETVRGAGGGIEWVRRRKRTEDNMHSEAERGP